MNTLLKTVLKWVLFRYRGLYAFVAGSDPHQRPWHFQWLPARIIRRDLRKVLADLEGEVLDVGCGERPYESWLSRCQRYVGADIMPGAGVDVVITPRRGWPIANESFDAVLCTQVVEHVDHIDVTLAEIERVLRPGGRLVITAPFIYGVHGAPHDYRRLTQHGLAALLPRGLRVDCVILQGAIGSTIGTLVLNWTQSTITDTPLRVLLTFIGLPVWLLFAVAINLVACVLDGIDSSGAFYGNVLLVATKL